MENLAPIVLFVFARPEHTKQTLEYLAANDLASDSDLIVYADAARNEREVAPVNEVRHLVRSVQGFRSVTVIERKTNYGLARNIIEGVGEVCQRYGRVIVLEDDLVTSSAFLTFMNQALNQYQNDNRVWHISGWNYPIDTEGLGDAFFLRVMNCWGWATWTDRWAHFTKNPNRLIESWNQRKKYHFDLDGSGFFWNQVTANAQKKINTWAIFWYATIYEKDGLCLNPSQSYVDNIGQDGSGIHCENVQNSQTIKPILCKNLQSNLPSELIESKQAIKLIQHYYKKQKKTFIKRAINKFARLAVGKNVF